MSSLAAQFGTTHRVRAAGLALLGLLLPVTAARAQTIINVPPDHLSGTISGDTILNVYDGASLVNVFAFGQATANFFGGSVANRVLASDESKVNLHGGVFGEQFQSTPSSAVTIFGVDFALNGVPIEGLEDEGAETGLDLTPGGVLSGTLADGSPFAFATNVTQIQDLDVLPADFFSPGTLTLVRSADPLSGPSEFNVPSDAAPRGLRGGQTLNLAAGGTLPVNFTAITGSTLNIAGGTVSDNLEVVGAQVDITGGTFFGRFDAFAGAIVRIEGADLGASLFAGENTRVEIAGGELPLKIYAGPGSSVAVEGGIKGALFLALSGSQSELATAMPSVDVREGAKVALKAGFAGAIVDSTGQVTMTGGSSRIVDLERSASFHMNGGFVNDARATFDSAMRIDGGSIGVLSARSLKTTQIAGGTFGGIATGTGATVGLFGTAFDIDGAAIPGLAQPGDSIVIAQRDAALLTAALLDGSPFELVLNELHPEATLRLTLTTVGDADLDGYVGVLDIGALTENWKSAGPMGDLDRSGEVNIFDVGILTENWRPAPMESVPEPATEVLLVLGLAAMATGKGVGRRQGQKTPARSGSEGNPPKATLEQESRGSGGQLTK